VKRPVLSSNVSREMPGIEGCQIVFTFDFYGGVPKTESPSPLPARVTDAPSRT
jgi:hypothetical protein